MRVKIEKNDIYKILSWWQRWKLKRKEKRLEKEKRKSPAFAKQWDAFVDDIDKLLGGEYEE